MLTCLSSFPFGTGAFVHGGGPGGDGGRRGLSLPILYCVGGDVPPFMAALALS